jgi:hypothetical protein
MCSWEQLLEAGKEFYMTEDDVKGIKNQLYIK